MTKRITRKTYNPILGLTPDTRGTLAKLEYFPFLLFKIHMNNELANFKL